MRNSQGSRDTAKQRMIRYPLEFEDTCKLARQLFALDPVEMQHRGVRGEAGPDRRDRVVLRPVDQSCETWIIRLIGETRSHGFTAGDDQRVDRRARQCV